MLDTSDVRDSVPSNPWNWTVAFDDIGQYSFPTLFGSNSRRRRDDQFSHVNLISCVQKDCSGVSVSTFTNTG